jgi:hypothetical protein
MTDDYRNKYDEAVFIAAKAEKRMTEDLFRASQKAAAEESRKLHGENNAYAKKLDAYAENKAYIRFKTLYINSGRPTGWEAEITLEQLEKEAFEIKGAQFDVISQQKMAREGIEPEKSIADIEKELDEAKLEEEKDSRQRAVAERKRAAAQRKRQAEIDKEVKREAREDRKKVRERIKAERKENKGPGALDKLKRMLFPQNYREYKTIADRDPTKPEYSENQRTYGYMQFFRKTGFCNDENASEPYRGRLDIESVPITDRLIMKNSPRFDWHIARRIAFTPQERQEYLSFNGKVPFIEKVKIVAEHFLNPKNLLGFGEAPTEVYKKKGESAEKERTQNQEIQEDNATGRRMNKAVERKRLEILEKRFGEEARRKLEREYGEDISRNRGGFGRGR